MIEKMIITHSVFEQLFVFCATWIIFTGFLLSVGRFIAGNVIDYRQWSFIIFLLFIFACLDYIAAIYWPNSLFNVFVPCVKSAFSMHILLNAFIYYIDVRYKKKTEKSSFFMALMFIYGMSLFRLVLALVMQDTWLSVHIVAIGDAVIKASFFATILLNGMSKKSKDDNEIDQNLEDHTIENIEIKVHE